MWRLLGVLIDWAIARLGIVPTTQLRVVTTIGLAVATGIVYLGLAIKVSMFGLHNPAVPGTETTLVWTPSYEWLGFLAVMAGIDTLHFFAKRHTHKPGGDAPPETKAGG
jgi:sterol desaturase/sphingolipid hydroxylase (fatty acid hydroxylase superfamily)